MAADFLDNALGLFAVNVLQQGSGDDENHLFLIEIPQNDAGNANWKIGDRQINCAVQQVFLQHIVGRFDEFHIHTGIFLLKGGDQLRHDGVSARECDADPQFSCLVI